MTLSSREFALASVRRLKGLLQSRLEQGESAALFHAALARPKVSGATVVAKPKAKAVDAGRFSELACLAETLQKCSSCNLAQTRRHVVFGEGDPKAELVFVGEAPDGDEDRAGRPFVGETGKLLTKIIESINLKREQVYVCNILKCRPPGNRNPLPEEIAACQAHLIRQLKLLQPKLIVALGTFAAQALLNTDEPFAKLRGQFQVWEGIPVMPTFHPAALLYHPQNKKLVWLDMLMVAKKLGLQLPGTKK